MTGNPALDVFVALGTVAGGLGLFSVLGRAGRRVEANVDQVKKQLNSHLENLED